MDITNLSLLETIGALESSKFSKEELNKAYTTRLSNLNPKLNAVLARNQKTLRIFVN